MKLARDKLDPIAGRHRGTNTALARGCISGDFVHSARDWQLRGRSINGFYVNPELNLMFGTMEMNVTLYAPTINLSVSIFFLLLPFNLPLSPLLSQEVSPTSSKKTRGGATGRERARGRRENASKTRRKADRFHERHALMPNKLEQMIGIRLLPRS